MMDVALNASKCILLDILLIYETVWNDVTCCVYVGDVITIYVVYIDKIKWFELNVGQNESKSCN